MITNVGMGADEAAKRDDAQGAAALFISYDGLLDPLGGSQILPYVRGIAAHPRRVHILSFEKPARYAASGVDLGRQLAGQGIGWTPLTFSRRYGKLGKLWDLIKMYGSAIRLQRQHRFGIIHCRSYLASQVGCLIKRIFGPKVIFDMRGLWVDERVDGGLWNMDRLQDRLAYRMYKRIETRLLNCADQVVTLTERSIPEIRRLAGAPWVPITVIPCCADFDSLVPPTRLERERIRRVLGIGEPDLVLAYLGSLGTWYQFAEMLRFFKLVRDTRPNSWWLIITKDWGDEHDNAVFSVGGSELKNAILVRPAERQDVRELLCACDVMLSFIRPARSKVASSPIKLGEALAMGIPSINSRGIGDVDQLVEALAAGVVIDPTRDDEQSAAVEQLEEIIAMSGGCLRERSRPHLGLEVALSRYQSVYETLERPVDDKARESESFDRLGGLH